MTQGETAPDIIAFFRDPASYPHPVDRVEHRQTHVSHLFFAGDYVYKLKKPLDLGFLDFTTLEKRRAASVAEVELNRRVAPDIYLDVVAVHRDGEGRLAFDAPTRVEEVAVLMRRLPEAWRLSRLVDSGQAKPEMMRRLGELIADFHERAETSPEIARGGSLDAIRDKWDENFVQTEPFIDRTLSRADWEMAKREIERFTRVYADLFEARVAADRIRDNHGDLQTNDIFVDPESGAVHVLDCIEFTTRFRHEDTLADVAFLSMDLRYRGADDLAEAFLDAYFDRSDDERIPALLRFYESYRAYVRGKVRSFVIDQSGPTEEEKEEAAEDARRYFRLAVADAARLRPRLILVTGLMGTGKTTLSKALTERAGIRALHSDVVRKQLAGLDPEEPREVPYGTDIYSAEWTERTYTALIDQARAALARGDSIVLDASWSKAEHRRRAREVAAEREALFAVVECRAPDEELRRRLQRPDRGATDGRLELLEDQRRGYEPPADDEAERVLRLDAVGDFDALADQVYDAIFDRGESRDSPSP